jgi:hypothetical protein
MISQATYFYIEHDDFLLHFIENFFAIAVMVDRRKVHTALAF